MNAGYWMKLMGVLAALLCVLSAGCKPGDQAASGSGGAGGGGKAPPGAPVLVASAELADVPVVIRTIGSVESRSRVMLRPQISGRVESISTNEGSDVTKAVTLVTLDPRPYQAALREAEAALAGSKASAGDAQHNLERMRSASTAMSQRDVEAAEAKAASAEADLLSRAAMADTARLNLEYCSIAAPFAGRLGQFLVKPGSIVKANETDLVEIVELDPIDVTFAVPEQELPGISAAKAAGPLNMEARAAGDTGAVLTGTLSFIDNRVDGATGSIRLKGTFDNASRRLWPGQFANVSLRVRTEKGRLLVPESAVQPSQQGPSVFVVKKDSTVEFRPVTVAPGGAVDGRTIIEEGLTEGEVVVTEGHLRLSPGARVEIKKAAEASKAGAGGGVAGAGGGA